MKTTLLSAAAALILSAALPVQAQFAKPDDAIKYRQSALSVMGTHFSRIGAMVNNRAPFDAADAQRSAEGVAFMASLPWQGFVEGSDKGAPTKAKPDIWAEKARFDEGHAKLREDTAKLAAAAKTGDLAQIRAAFGDTAQTCKACHDAYRSR